jgi:tetraspanin-18
MLESCMSCVIIIINIFVMLLGLVILIIGALVTWGSSTLYNILQPTLTSILKSGLYQSSGVDPVQITSYILDLVKFVGWPLFLIGIIIVAIAVCGVFGACYKLKILLLIYILVTYAITAALIAVCIAFYAADDQIDTFAKSYLVKTLLTYTGHNATNVETILWTLINAGVQCCGVTNGTDFVNATQWPRNYTYNNVTYNLQYPISCCKADSSFKITDTTCFSAPNGNNSNHMIGCYSQIRSQVKSYSFVALGVIVAIIVAEMTLMLFAACVCQDSS